MKLFTREWKKTIIMAVNWQVHHHHSTVCGRMFFTIGSTSSEFHDIKREDLTVYAPYCKQQSLRKTVNTAFCLRESKKKSCILNSRPWIPVSRYWNPDSFQYWMPDSLRIPKSLICIPDSKAQDSGFWITLHGATEIFQEY